MERKRLKEARIAKGIREKRCLTQAEVAFDLGCSVDIYSRWERGLSEPKGQHRRKLMEYYSVTDPFDLDLLPESLLGLGDIVKMLGRYDRHDLIEQLQVLPAFAELNLSALLDQPRIAPEDFLGQCRVAVDICSDQLDHGSGGRAEILLNMTGDRLAGLAEMAPYRTLAANLAVQARIMLMIIALRRRDVVACEHHGIEAVRLGKLSGDSNIHTMALGWHGNMHLQFYHQPETAIVIFSNAFEYDDISLLNKADIRMSMAAAYAYDQNSRDKALEMIVQARDAMPEHPELDPLYRHIRTGPFELDMREAATYLILAEKYPEEGYAQMALVTLGRSSKQAINRGYQGMALIHKANALRLLDDMDECVACLTGGLLIGIELGSLKQLAHIQNVLSCIPPRWQKETPIQRLQEELSQALMIVPR